MKGDHEVILAIFTFVVGFAVATYLATESITIDLIPAVSTLVAAFVGAWYAFQLNNDREEAKRRAAEKAAVNRAIYLIFRMWNNLASYNKDIIEPAIASGAPWLSMQATVNTEHERIQFPEDELSFLLSVGQAHLYAELLMEYQRYLINIGVIRELSATVGDKLFPKMEELGYRRSEKVEVKDVENQLGPALTQRLKDLTQATITNTRENMDTLREAHDKLRAAMTRYFDGERLISVQFEIDNKEKSNIPLEADA